MRFVLIGGLALNAWGVIRGTKDADVVADPDPENLLAVASAAASLGGQVQLADSFVSSEPGIAAALGEGRRTLIETNAGALDVVTGIPGVPSYADLIEGAVPVEIGGVTVMVCSVNDLRMMTIAAGRPQDLVDLDNLEIAEGSGEPGAEH